MNILKSFAARSYVKARSVLQSIWLSYPKEIQCNICKWEGRHFLSDSWHEHINCPRCRSEIRQRLFIAALQNIEKFSFREMVDGKEILHFAPENTVTSSIRRGSARYNTADYLRTDCDFKLDMSHMSEVAGESYDVLIAFDVLEHIPDYQKALEEVHRVLRPGGWAIFTVPQKDNLAITYEDPSIVSPEDRTVHFGQWDHLRIFGDDFDSLVESKGFDVTAVNESMFSESTVRKHVLFPPVLSRHPLATNYRKVFFCRKPPDAEG